MWWKRLRQILRRPLSHPLRRSPNRQKRRRQSLLLRLNRNQRRRPPRLSLPLNHPPNQHRRRPLLRPQHLLRTPPQNKALPPA